MEPYFDVNNFFRFMSFLLTGETIFIKKPFYNNGCGRITLLSSGHSWFSATYLKHPLPSFSLYNMSPLLWGDGNFTMTSGGGENM
jgi:hypothetical protein